MLSLLTPSDFNEINNAIRDVTDTFATSLITYIQRGNQLTRFEEAGAVPNETRYDLEAFVEHTPKDMTFKEQGGIQEESITALFNYDYLVEQGLVTSDNLPVFKNDGEHLEWRGVRYRITSVQPEGLLNQKWSIVNVLAQRDKH